MPGFSSAGLQLGGAEGSGTRSSLLWECRKAILAKRPKYILFENVKALLQKKFKPYFLKWVAELEEYGYANFYQVLNAKDYGVPQNRERVFMVSILDKSASYDFPKPFPLVERLKDRLEKNVPESYYLKPEQVARIVAHCDRKVAEGCGFKTNFQTPDGISGTITTKQNTRPTDTYIAEPKIMQVGNLIEDSNYSNPHRGRVYSENGISPTLCGHSGGQLEPKILNDYRIRKLTERECYRLMDLNDAEIDKILATGISKTQCYRTAGNSICVSCMTEIFDSLFFGESKKPKQLTLF